MIDIFQYLIIYYPVNYHTVYLLALSPMPYTCFIIGEGTQLTDCATILQKSNFQVKGIISSDPAIRHYCAETRLRCFDLSTDYLSILQVASFDYLFTINADHILSESTLSLPKQATINYQQEVATIRADINESLKPFRGKKKTYGTDIDSITNHSQFISGYSTEKLINLTSRGLPVTIFQQLIDKLLAGVPPIQSLSRSSDSYLGHHKQPDTFIDWHQSAAKTVYLHRKLAISLANPLLGYLKIKINSTCLLVKELSESSDLLEASQHLPGMVIAIDPHAVQIATGDGILKIEALSTLSGEPIDGLALSQQWGVQAGQVLTSPSVDFKQRFDQAHQLCVPFQSYWLKKLSRHLTPTTLSIELPSQVQIDQKQSFELTQVHLPTVIEAVFAEAPLSVDKSNWLLGTFLITLARLGNQLSVMVGYSSPISTKLATDTSNCLADCRPLIIDFEWESDFSQALTAIHKEREAIDQHLTFAHERVVAQRDSPTIEQRASEPKYSIIIHQLATESDTAMPMHKDALALIMVDMGDCYIKYDTCIFHKNQVTELINRWLIVLKNLIEQPAQPLKSVSLLTAAERQTMLIDWNTSAIAPYPQDQAVHRLVETQVQQRPQANALRCGPVTLTYEDLNQRANQLAWHLNKFGVQPETLVGICMDRSLDMVVSLLAILKTGGAYVPLDPAFPPSRLEELRSQTNVRFVITQQKWLDRLPVEGTTYILTDQEPSQWANESTENLSTAVNLDNLAYVLFTSGSTGKPKSVAIPHRGIVRLVKGANYMRLDETVIMLGISPLAFDLSTLDLWGILSNGGLLVLMEDRQPTLEAIKQTILINHINTTFFTTALFNVIVDSGIEELTTLTQLVTGGEAASAEHVRRAKRQLPFCTIINGYGPTESTTFASFYNLSATDWKTSSVPIGKPLSNTQLYIVDSFLNPVPVGVTGEILIGGDGLAREYLFQPELTRQKFIADPFDPESHRRLYRSGDLARYLSDGTIEFLGRLDDQIKIRGFRIEPGEIVHALYQYPTVGEAIIIVAEPTPGNKVLAAYLVPKLNTTIVPAEVKAFLQAKLPSHLIPSVFIPLQAVPLTPNGKLDKSRLPPPFPRSQKQSEEVLTPTETALLQLWNSILSNTQSSRDDHFFDLGGSSLLALQLIARIQQQFGRTLNLKDLFEHPTIRLLSAYLDQLPEPVSIAIAPQIPIGEPTTDAIVPLSFAQKRLWVIHQFQAIQSAYNIPIVLRIRGALDLSVLQKSLTEIVRRHQVLRTTFSQTNGIPNQIVAPPESAPMLVGELVALEIKSTVSLANWIKTEAYLPFNLEEGPLVRFKVAQLDMNTWVVLLVFHHIIYDGWSTRVLASEMNQLYTSLLHNQSVTLPDLSIQYTDYALWQDEQYSFQIRQREITYWKNRLAGVPVLLSLPIDKPRPAIQSFEGADYTFQIAADRWQQIQTGLQEPNTTPFLRLLTVFAIWLSRVTLTKDIVVGIPVAGRSRPELAHNLGFFVNTLALRIALSENTSFRDLLRQVRELALEAYDHQELAFEQVVEALKPPRSLAYDPLVQVIFDFQESNAEDWKLDNLQVESVRCAEYTAKFDLHLSFRDNTEGMECIINYRTDLFTQHRVTQMAHDFTQLLDELVNQPDMPLSILLIRPDTLISIPSTDPTIGDPFTQNALQQSADGSYVALLKPIWAWLLGVSTVGLDDNFFDLGGHSLLAARLTSEIKRETGQNIPISSVFANPTIRTLVNYIKNNTTDLIWPSLVVVKPQGDKKPLFLVHPLSGDIGYVYRLAPYLPTNRPVFGLRAVGLDGITEPLQSIEAMATYYIQLIIEQQPTGPYSLGGFSLGGTIAFEIARQLKELGHDISLLAMLDSYPETTNRSNRGHMLRYYYYSWCSMPKRRLQILKEIRQRVSDYILKKILSLLSGPPQKVISQQIESNSVTQFNILDNVNQQALSTYKFKPYNGRIVFLRATGTEILSDIRSTVTFGWNRYVKKRVYVHLFPGKHLSLVNNEENLSKVGETLSSYLKELD